MGENENFKEDPVFKAYEIVYQKKSKQRARENQTFKEQEKECQNQSKKGQGKIHMFLHVRESRSNK